MNQLTVTTGQMQYEWEHFLRKIETRDNKLYHQLKILKDIKPHPIFTVIEGDIEDWEIL